MNFDDFAHTLVFFPVWVILMKICWPILTSRFIKTYWRKMDSLQRKTIVYLQALERISYPPVVAPSSSSVEATLDTPHVSLLIDPP